MRKIGSNDIKKRITRIGLKETRRKYSERDIQRLINQNDAAPQKGTKTDKTNLSRFGTVNIPACPPSPITRKKNAEKKHMNPPGTICVVGSGRVFKGDVSVDKTTIVRGKKPVNQGKWR